MLAIEYKNEPSSLKRHHEIVVGLLYEHTMRCMLYEVVSFRLYGQHICGGSLIGYHYVLTAAHCVYRHLEKVEYMGVGLGHSRLNDRQVIHGVKSVLVHPEFSDYNPVVNDIALIKLRDPARVNNITISIIPIAQEPPKKGELCTISGWGTTTEPSVNEPGEPVNQLRSVDVPIVDPGICATMSGVNESYICAGEAAGGKDSCQGDSGGPLACDAQLAGVVSWGVGCGRKGFPGFYTDVSYFAEWISNNSLALPTSLLSKSILIPSLFSFPCQSTNEVDDASETNSTLDLPKHNGHYFERINKEVNATFKRLLVQISEVKEVLKFAELLVFTPQLEPSRKSCCLIKENLEPAMPTLTISGNCTSQTATATNMKTVNAENTCKELDSTQRMVEVHCNGWVFHSNFDSGNLGKVESVVPTGASKSSCSSSESISEVPDFEFNVWTRPDCAGTEFENGNRTWFYFGVRGGQPFSSVRINIVNLNKQCKMYAQGMTPVYRILPGKPQWERIKDKPSFNMEDKQFTVSFMFRFGDTINQTVYFAFTYPYTYSDLLSHFSSVESQLKNNSYFKDCNAEPKQDDIYYQREVLTYSLESRRIDLITISSHHGITKVREPRLPNLFPDENNPRPFKFLPQKKVIFLSARVHPGETPSSFVMAGMINFLLSREDPIAFALRRHFVFKLIPMLNPDGVFRGNYRTDTRGVNLNRVYGNPSLHFHPSIYGARAMIRYYHYGFAVPEDEYFDKVVEERISGLSLSKSQSSLGSSESANFRSSLNNDVKSLASVDVDLNTCDNYNKLLMSAEDSGLFLYIDMHGHTSKKGIFMYGNHFENMNMKIECMLFPKLITLYSQHFLFDSCNFTEKNMYVKDRRDGSSREGCGRVAVFKATGLVRSYTLECNYNTGKNLNMLPPPYREPMDRRSQTNLIVPPKYNPSIYEEVGKSVLSALLDLVGMHPNTRLVNSVYRSLATVREVLRKRLIMEELSEKEEAIEKRRFSGRITARKMRVNKEGRSRIVGRGETSRTGRRGTLTQDAASSLPSRKPSEKKKKKKLKEEGTSSSRRRIEKKCGAESLRRHPLEHRRKKLKPK